MVSAGWAQEFPEKPEYDMTLKNMQMQMNMMHRCGHDSADQLSEELVMAAPSLVGTWKGSAPKITSTGVCSSDLVILVISKQCGNLVKGTAKVGAYAAITVLGRYYTSAGIGYIMLTGHVLTPIMQSITLFGSYSATPTPRFNITEFLYINQSIVVDQEFDLFTLVK